MIKALKKIPITFWTLVIISLCVYVVFYDVFGINGSKSESADKVDLIGKVLTIVGLYFLAIQVKNQTKSETISNEFLNQSNFAFTGFCAEDIINERPKLCTHPDGLNYNQCTDIHWFNFKQIGNLPAKDFNIALIHENEKNDIAQIIKKRTVKLPMVYKDDKRQYKLTPFAIPFSNLNTVSNGLFYILLEYKSVYTNIKYKRIYSLGYKPLVGARQPVTTWINNIEYFELSLLLINDSETQTWSNLLANLWNKLLVMINIKTTISADEWLIDL